METNEYDSHIAILISKLLKGEITPDENVLLGNWVNNQDENRQLFNKLLNPEYLQAQLDHTALIDTKTAWNKIEDKIENKVKDQLSVNKPYSRLLKYAAVIFPFLLVTALLFYVNNKKQEQLKNGRDQQTVQVPQIQPGGKHAVLILSNGRKVELGSENKQTIKEEDGTSLNNRNEILAYNGRHEPVANRKILFNTIAIPRGGEYQLILEDGTKVWLNSSSSLRYPTKFTKTDRIVYLTGEAYFEVAKNKSAPFLVKTSRTCTSIRYSL
ncbi:FecR family protein [Pedobacter sp. NJ-S-72]